MPFAADRMKVHRAMQKKEHVSAALCVDMVRLWSMFRV